MKKSIIAIVLSGLFMNVSEFVRNEFLFKQSWLDAFNALGLTFPSAPINGVVWMCWSFLLCGILVLLLETHSIVKSTLIIWITGFVLMWMVLLNLGVFPTTLLTIAIPWSLAEVYVAALIGSKCLNKS